jgi:hypothetical protein
MATLRLVAALFAAAVAGILVSISLDLLTGWIPSLRESWFSSSTARAVLVALIGVGVAFPIIASHRKDGGQ